MILLTLLQLLFEVYSRRPNKYYVINIRTPPFRSCSRHRFRFFPLAVPVVPLTFVSLPSGTRRRLCCLPSLSFGLLLFMRCLLVFAGVYRRILDAEND